MRQLLAGLLFASIGTAQVPELTLREIEFPVGRGRTTTQEEGSFTVPVRRGAGNKDTLTLRFVRFKSSNPDPGPPIVYLAGGPGGAGTDAAKGARFRMFWELRAVADVIAFDQRGTGLSDRLPPTPGGWSVSTTEPVWRAEVEAAVEDYVTRSARYWRALGVNLAGFQTNESADDLEDLRLALGAEKLQLLAISYGTHLALATLRRHPDSIARVVLAGTEGPDHTVKPPSQQEALLEEIARRIQLDPEARESYPDFLEDLRDVLTRAEEQPLDGVVTRFDLQRWVAGKLRGPETFADLPERVAEMKRGDYWAVVSALPDLRGGRLGAMSGAMDAASGMSRERQERIERERTETLLGDAINFPYGPLRAGLGVRDLGDEFRAPLHSTVPALFISGTLDGRTPPENAEETRAGFSESVHWILDGAGHSDPLFLSSPEIIPGIRDFFAGEALEDRTIELPPIRFTVGSALVLPTEVLERYVGQYGGRIESEITLENGQLRGAVPAEGKVFPLQPVTETLFEIPGVGITVEFLDGGRSLRIDEPGQITVLTRREVAEATLRIAPDGPTIVGDPLHIRLEGVAPGSRVEMVAVGRDHEQVGESRAHFVADSAGTVDLDRDAPVAGSYAGIDPAGLFWSLRPTAGEGHGDPNVHEVEISALIDGEPIATAKHQTYLKHPSVRSEPIRHDGIYATYHDPGLPGPRPVVVIVGGSGGGIGWQDVMGGLLASHGYVAVSLAYFRVDPLPAMLKDIPLEYFDRVIDGLASREDVNIAVMGYSKGAELALLLGATNPNVSAVVSYSGSSAVFQAPRAPEPTSSWSRNGESLPYVPTVFIPNRHTMSEMYMVSLADGEAVERARIPVEQTQGAILLLSGESDQSWPASLMSEQVVQRLEQAEHPHEYRHLSFPGAGHEINLPGYLPTVSDEGHGERPAATARARRLGWAEVLAFLDRNLKGKENREVQHPPAPDLEAEVDRYLEPYLETGNFSGSVLVAKEGEVLLSKGYGLANVDDGVQNESQTSFYLASVSRILTSAAILLLEQQGNLSVEDRLSKYFPDWPRGDEITLHHLLTLSAGFPNINSLPGYGFWTMSPQTPASLIEKFRNLPLEFPPGTRSVHSNSNYNVLAALIEMVSGRSYGQYLEEEFFAPLGMTRTAHDGDPDRSVPHRAIGYRPVGLADFDTHELGHWSVKTGNASIYSTTEDLYKFDRMLVDATILNEASVKKLFTEHFPTIGYGWFVTEAYGSPRISLSGRSPGFGAYWVRLVDHDLTAIVLGNLYNGVPATVGSDLVAMVSGEEFEPPVIRYEAPDPELLAEFVGAYQFGPDFYAPNAAVRFHIRDGHLFNGSDWAIPAGDTKFVHRTYWSDLEFQRDATGKVDRLKYDDFVGKRIR